MASHSEPSKPRRSGSKSLKGTWADVGKDLALVLLVVFGLRWAVAEPFLVPSGSMIPTLLVKDYILATKFSYGLRVPFTKIWLWGPHQPQRGDVVVFKSKGDDFYFMVKRVVGLPGDRISFDQESKRLSINGELQESEFSHQDERGFRVFQERFHQQQHSVQYSELNLARPNAEVVLSEDEIFVMGDNRDRSSDSRMWGALPLRNLMGKAAFIWMSCEGSASDSSVFCIGSDLRAERLFKKIK